MPANAGRSWTTAAAAPSTAAAPVRAKCAPRRPRTRPGRVASRAPARAGAVRSTTAVAGNWIAALVEDSDDELRKAHSLVAGRSRARARLLELARAGFERRRAVQRRKQRSGGQGWLLERQPGWS